MPTSCMAVVVGAGPAGLAAAACLKRTGIDPVVLEAGASVGTSWRRHYERLHLHTVKEHSALPGVPFAAEVPRYPSRLEVVRYLDAYAGRSAIAPRVNEAVRRITSGDGGFIVETTREIYRSPIVVVATGMNRVPNPDQLPDQSAFEGAVIHSTGYRSWRRLRGPARAGGRRGKHGRGDRARSRRAWRGGHALRPHGGQHRPPRFPGDAGPGHGNPVSAAACTRARPHRPADVARCIRRSHALRAARRRMGPVSSIVQRGRIPIIDVGTVEAIKQGRIAVKPGVARLTRRGARSSTGATRRLMP